jgi:hypothetical protein
LDEEFNVITTQSGHAIKPTQHLSEETRYAGRDEIDSDYGIELPQAEINYYEAMRDFPQKEFAPGEVACMGAGIGGGFTNTIMEIHVMKYDWVMQGPEASKEWAIAMDE